MNANDLIINDDGIIEDVISHFHYPSGISNHICSKCQFEISDSRVPIEIIIYYEEES